jgi:hypothetical protein
MDQGEKVRNFGKTVLIQVKNRKKHLKNTRWSIKFTKKAAENIYCPKNKTTHKSLGQELGKNTFLAFHNNR